MEIKELRLKEITELNQLLKDNRKKLDDLKFKIKQGQLKNIREIRLIKKDIAKILTVIREKNK